VSDQFYFTKELVSCTEPYWKYRSQRSKSKPYHENPDNDRYCPRCNNYHKGNCTLIQMIVEINTVIDDKKNFMVTFLTNIKIPLWNRDVAKEYEIFTGQYIYFNHETVKEQKKYYSEQVKEDETILYKYIDDIEQSSFNITLLNTSFADDELESFRTNANTFEKLFIRFDISNIIGEIKYILLTNYKNTYISKEEFLEKHKPALYKDLINKTLADLYKFENRIIIFAISKSKSDYMKNEIIKKLTTLYLDYHINPVFDSQNSTNMQKPNPHIEKKKKQK
jgi:hypothetical protein